jgi:hypothetical protein
VSRFICELRIRLADEEGGSVTDEGGGIWIADRSGIARGFDDDDCVCEDWTSAMIAEGMSAG